MFPNNIFPHYNLISTPFQSSNDIANQLKTLDCVRSWKSNRLFKAKSQSAVDPFDRLPHSPHLQLRFNALSCSHCWDPSIKIESVLYSLNYPECSHINVARGGLNDFIASWSVQSRVQFSSDFLFDFWVWFRFRWRRAFNDVIRAISNSVLLKY